MKGRRSFTISATESFIIEWLHSWNKFRDNILTHNIITRVRFHLTAHCLIFHDARLILISDERIIYQTLIHHLKTWMSMYVCRLLCLMRSVNLFEFWAGVPPFLDVWVDMDGWIDRCPTCYFRFREIIISI